MLTFEVANVNPELDEAIESLVEAAHALERAALEKQCLQIVRDLRRQQLGLLTAVTRQLGQTQTGTNYE